jgi:hypothetical protein
MIDSSPAVWRSDGHEGGNHMAEHQEMRPEVEGEDVEGQMLKETLAAGAVSAALFAGQAQAQNVDPGGPGAAAHWADPGGGATGANVADPAGGTGGA